MSKLAVDGGKAVREKPFPVRIIFDEKEKRAVLRVVEKTMSGPEAIDLCGSGPEVEAYKKGIRPFLRSKICYACEFRDCCDS